MNKLSYYFFRFCILYFALIPFAILYPISNILAFMFEHLIGYRKKIIYDNLRRSFPNKNEKEIKQIAHGFYQNFSDIVLESFKGFSLSKKEAVRRYKMTNVDEQLLPYFNQGKNVIAIGAHYTNWEWGALCSGLQFQHHPYGFYKPITNPFIDNYIRKKRKQFRMDLVHLRDTEKTFSLPTPSPVAYIMLADQSPSNAHKSYWINFLNQETACLHGPEKYAQRTNCPVVFINIKRVERGMYEVDLVPLAENSASLPEGKLTYLYMKELEKHILAAPKNWLWSHRRWKKTRPADKKIYDFK